MEQHDALNNLIRKTRRITNTIKVVPFIYSVIFIVVFVIYNQSSVFVQEMLDWLFYVSPMMALVHIIYSKMLELCFWHRVTCIIPIIPQLGLLVDSYLTQSKVMVFNICFIAVMVLLVVSAYKVFLHGGKRRVVADS